MCGIAGILSFKNNVETHKIKQMTDALIHRGPDGEGQWVNDKSNIGLGHRRLSIIDLTDAGSQPMHYANNKYSITFNGEIYNYLEIKEVLISKGYQFHTKTDTEVVLAAYDYWGQECLKQFDGMFAFAIWNEQKQEIFCARDRFGEKPFFYFNDNKQFVFASEIKALWKADIEKEVSEKAIYNYLLFGTVEDINFPDETFYKNIKKLEPATYLLINNKGIVEKEKYWKVDLNKTNKISIEEAKTTFYNLFVQSVERRLRSDVAVGSSLSGGIDSSSIVTIIDRIKGGNQEQKTFSARFKNFEKDEGYFIKKVLNNAKNVKGFDVYPSEQSLIDNWEKIIYHQDEPFGSFSIAAQYEVMQLAKKNDVTVLLDGQGADETLAGYNPYFKTYYSYLKNTNSKKYFAELSAFEKLYNKEFEKIDFKTKLRQKNQLVFTFAGKQRRKLLSVNNKYFVGINPEIVKKYKDYTPPIAQFNNLKGHLYYSTFTKGLSELLRYADRNSMAHSVEVRLPFLSHELVEFVFSLPEELLINNAWTKFVLRKSMENVLPKEITWRKDKIGYEPPQNKWINNDYFINEINNSVKILKEKGFISKEFFNLNWKYIMLAKYL